MNAKTPMLRAIASSNSGPAGPEVASGNVLSIRKHRSKRVFPVKRKIFTYEDA